jgi:Matrixin
MRRHLVAAVIIAIVALSATSTPAYNITGRRWAVNPVDFYINPANADVTQTAAISAILAGANAWSTQSAADVSLYYVGPTNGTSTGANGKNEVFFRPDTGSGAIATTYWWTDSSNHVIDADIVFYDGSFAFFTGSSGCSGGYYIEDVATHEFGHALGISHSDVAEATMVSGTGPCNTAKRSLALDDVAAIEALYPGGGAQLPPPPPPPPQTETSLPAAPTGPSPADGSTGIQVSSIGWAAAVGATSYDVYVGTGSNPPLFAANVTGTSVSLSKLANSTTYYWRVVSRNGVGSTSGGVWRFTTRARPGKGR